MAQGTITLTNGSTAVAGVGTDFTTIGSGDFITTTIGGVPYTIAVGTVQSATALTLAIPFDGPTAAGLAFENTGVNTMALATMGVTVQAQKALRFLIADGENWRKIFSNDQQITITTPGGQQITGMSWGYLSQLLQTVDPVQISQDAQTAQQGAADATAARDQTLVYRNDTIGVKNEAVTAKTQAELARDTAVSAKDQAEGFKNEAIQAKDWSQTYRNQAEQFANSIDPSQLMRKDANLSDVADKAAARNNLELGPNNEVAFKSISVNRGVANESGYVTLPALDSNGAQISSSKIYNEYKNGRAATVIATQGPSGTYYLQYSEQGALDGVTQFKSTPGTGFINQGGENNNIEISAPQAIPLDTWSGYMRFRWYSDYVNIGAVRGGSTSMDSYAIEVFKSGDDTTTYKFFPQGYMTARAYNGRCTAGAYGLELSPTGNSVPFNARNAPNNNGGWVPIVVGGSETPQGYGLRVALGATSPGESGWGTAMVKMMGDTNKHRAYSFDVTGGISTWASDNDGTWGANYDFAKNPTSDRDLKEDIVYTNGVESFNRVMQWLPTLFKYKGSATQRFGLIAQDLLKVDPQYVKLVPGSPVFEDVIGVDASGEEYVHHQIETDRRDDTLALDSNVMLVDMACAMVYMGGKLAELEARMAELEK